MGWTSLYSASRQEPQSGAQAASVGQALTQVVANSSCVRVFHITRTQDRLFQSTSQEDSQPGWRRRRPRVRRPVAMMCHERSRAAVHQGRLQVQVEGKALRRVLALLFVICADSSFTDPSRPEGAGPEAPGGRGTFRVTDTTPERALRCGLSFTVW